MCPTGDLGALDSASVMMRRRGTSANERADDGDGSRGIGLAIAGATVVFFATMPFVFVVALYVFLTVYAIVRAIGPGFGENPVTIVVGFVLITSVFAVLLGVTIHLIGRSITPRRRRAKP